MSTRKSPAKTDEPASSKKGTARKNSTAVKKTSTPRRWSVAQQIAFLAVLIPVLGGCATAVFANWDKLTAPLPAQTEVPVIDVVTKNRIEYVKESQERIETKIEATNQSVTDGVTASWNSNKVSKRKKAQNAADGEKLVAQIKLQRLKVNEAYAEWTKAVGAKDETKADLMKVRVANEVLALQRLVDRQLQKTGLKDFVPPPDFTIHQQDQPKSIEEAQAPKGTAG